MDRGPGEGGRGSLTGLDGCLPLGVGQHTRWNEMEGVGGLLNGLWGDNCGGKTGGGLDCLMGVGVGEAFTPDVCPV